MPTSRKTYRNDNVKISINGYTLLGLLISSLRVECKASETLHIHLGLAIRAQDAVLLLLNIGELSIDVTLTVGDGMSRVGQGLIALKKGFFIGNLAMIFPRTAAFVLECNIAIFSQQEGLVACPFFAVAVDRPYGGRRNALLFLHDLQNAWPAHRLLRRNHAVRRYRSERTPSHHLWKQCASHPAPLPDSIACWRRLASACWNTDDPCSSFRLQEPR